MCPQASQALSLSPSVKWRGWFWSLLNFLLSYKLWNLLNQRKVGVSPGKRFLHFSPPSKKLALRFVCDTSVRVNFCNYFETGQWCSGCHSSACSSYLLITLRGQVHHRWPQVLQQSRRPRWALSSQTSPNPRATPDLHVTPSVKMRSNSTTNLNSKTTSNPAPLIIAGTPKIATPMNTTTMTSGGTTLNPTGSTHFLCYVIFLLFCVQSAWRGLELSTFLSQFFIICWMITSTLGKSNLFQLTS